MKARKVNENNSKSEDSGMLSPRDEESDPIRFDHRLASEEDAKTRWSEKWEEEMERVESREDDINKSKGQRRREDGKRFRM